MGGVVKVAIRFEDGTRWANVRHTNAVNWSFHVPEMITDSNEVLRKYASMDSPWHNGDNTLTPAKYGLIVLDAVTKRIHSFNDHSTIGKIHPMSLEGLDDETHSSFMALMRHGALSAVDSSTKEPFPQFFGKDAKNVMIEAIRFQQFLAANDANKGHVRIDLSPWAIANDFMAPPVDTLDILSSEGFLVTEADREGFAKWLDQKG